MTTELKYDPEYPYVVWVPNEEILAKFRVEDDALLFQDSMGIGEVIDTTPKPKIPEDAEYVIWEYDGEKMMAWSDGVDWQGNSEYWTHDQLLEETADAEVTVLVRKEEP